MPHHANVIPGFVAGSELIGRFAPYVRHCGDERRGPWKIQGRKLLDYLLVYIEDGRGRFTVDGVGYDAEPGDVFWIPPDTIHEMEGFAPGMTCPYVHFDLIYRGDISHWDFTIPGGTLELEAYGPLMHPVVDSSRVAAFTGRIRGYTNVRVGRLVEEICAEAARAQPYATLRMSGLVLAIVAELLRGQAGLDPEQHAHVPVLEEAAAHLRAECARDISLEEVAAWSGLSPAYFRRLFGQHFGVSPREYLRNARIQKAKQLMIASGMNLSQIARAVGFATVHSFSRAFRTVEGISPSAYRSCGQGATRVTGRIDPYPR